VFGKSGDFAPSLQHLSSTQAATVRQNLNMVGSIGCDCCRNEHSLQFGHELKRTEILFTSELKPMLGKKAAKDLTLLHSMPNGTAVCSKMAELMPH
jgi:hypothetical protein